MAALTASLFVMLSACVSQRKDQTVPTSSGHKTKILEQKLKCIVRAVLILDPHQEYEAGHILDPLLFLNQQDHIGGMHRR